MQNINDEDWNSWIFSSLSRDSILINMSDHTVDVTTTLLESNSYTLLR